jgi:hypothetical protein
MKKLTDKISFRLLATRKHNDYDWLHDTLKKELKPKSFLDNRWVKILFSISIMLSAVPSIYEDFTYGHQGTWTHYGMALVGILYFIESLLWTLDLWKKN